MPRKGYSKADDKPTEARTKRLEVRLTAKEHSHLLACVEASTAPTNTDYVRRLIMGERPPARKGAANVELLRQLSKAGINLNQISRNLNTGRTIEPAGFQAAIDELRYVLEKVALGE